MKVEVFGGKSVASASLNNTARRITMWQRGISKHKRSILEASRLEITWGYTGGQSYAQLNYYSHVEDLSFVEDLVARPQQASQCEC